MHVAVATAASVATGLDIRSKTVENWSTVTRASPNKELS
jgi:hypothetical protein